MADFDEVLPEEMDEREQQLIEGLRRLYPTPADVAPHLARVQQRLFHADNNTLDNHMSNRHPSRMLKRERERPHTMNVNDSRFTVARGRAWQRRFSTLAAAVFAALLVGSLIFLLNRAHQSRTGGPSNPSYQAGAVTSLHMIDATTGWALTENALLRTTDGGSHWQNVTPPNVPVGPGSVAEFRTAELSWIATRPTNAATALVLRTTDGGRTWQQASIQATFVKQITFLDAQHGWLLSGEENAAGAPAEAISVWRTTDGGKTWQSVATALFADATPPGHLPYGGQKSGIRFLNTTTGWVTGTVTANDLAWLYVTHDGGSTWYQQTLPRPSDVPSAQLSIQSPTFFSATDGLLPVRFSDLTTGRGIATVVYVTHDGGTTWKPTASVPVALGTSHFLDMRQGWMTDGTVLFVTSDEGQHWTRLAANTNFKHVIQLDFVSSTVGWAVSDQSSSSSLLLKTRDGGQTWTPITVATP